LAVENGPTAKDLLDFEVSEGGMNLSAGQRQLINSLACVQIKSSSWIKLWGKTSGK